MQNMKKFYNRLVIDIESGSILEEDSFLYDGPCLECKGDVSTPAPPPKSDDEKAIDTEYLASLRAYNARLEHPEQYYTESEKLLNELTTQALKGYLEDFPKQKEYQQKTMDYTTKLVDFNLKQLENVQTVKELSSYTGELTTEEKTDLDTMAANAKAKIAESVNEETRPIIEARIAELADRGVLQGSVASSLLGEIAASAQKAIARGATDVETARLGQELAIQQTNKDRALSWANYGLNQQQIFSGLSGQNSSVLRQPLMDATQQTQYASGLTQRYGMAGTQGMQQWLGYQQQERGAEANRALQGAIAEGQSKSTVAAGQWGAAGATVGAAAIVAAAVI